MTSMRGFYKEIQQQAYVFSGMCEAGTKFSFPDPAFVPQGESKNCYYARTGLL